MYIKVYIPLTNVGVSITSTSHEESYYTSRTTLLVNLLRYPINFTKKEQNKFEFVSYC